MSISWRVAAISIAATALLAVGSVRADERQEKEESDKVDTENLFGFTEGTDTGRKGEQEVILDTIVGVSRRRAGPGRSGYAAAQTVLSYQYDATDDLSIEPGLLFDARRSRNIAGAADKSTGTFDGTSLELKYQFHKRTDASPFGLALQVEPQWRRVEPDSGRGADVASVDARLMADVRLVPDKLWFGTNLIYEPEVWRLRGSGKVDKDSTLTWSGSLVAQVASGFFLGPELRYARAYDGGFLNRFEGHATFLGPVLHYQVAERGFFTLAYSAQVAGRERGNDGPSRALELSEFSRHTVRVRFGLEF